MSLISSYCKQCIFLDVQTKLDNEKEHFFTITLLRFGMRDLPQKQQHF
jgi:hypothetical protein